MTTQFFERQEVQRKYTRWLVVGFAAAILAVVLAINVIVVVGLGGHPMRVLEREPAVIVWVSIIVLGTILVSSWRRSWQLRAGGATIAQQLGGVRVMDGETDLARKRLVNIVEEMAIAARIRKPQVFVLPDESAINAFAAGHTPDEAAVAVTQGALDKLDREQLQAVIGHEFSHILNGDMQINMRLTAWIFGLFVITDLAGRFMRGRSRGKGAARLKIIAFGVFLAGSVGMFAGRLLQAAVSRRREHLADASSVQFTRNPGALSGAFITMAAHPQGSRLEHESAAGVAHMFFGGSDPSWANKIGGSWFATHPPLEERVRAIDGRISPTKFKLLVSDERRKLKQREKQAAEAAAGSSAAAPAADTDAVAGVAAAIAPAAAFAPDFAPGTLDDAALMISAAAPPAKAPTRPQPMPARGTPDAGATPGLSLVHSGAGPALEAGPGPHAETMPSGVRQVAGRSLPPDLLRNRLSQEQQNALLQHLAQLERDPVAVQGLFVATMLASEPAKWRPQLTKLAPLLGIELLKATQAQIARVGQLALPARLPLLLDLLPVLENLDPAERKRLRALARAFAPTVVTGDMLRFGVTRILERKFAKAVDEPAPVPLPERAAAVCELYQALAQCRFGGGKQGLNSYRAGVMGMMPPQKWSPYPEALLTPAQLDAALQGVRQVHPTGKRSFSEGLARVVAVGGRLTVPQIDLLRSICVIVECAVPLIPIDVVYEETDLAPPGAQASAR